MEQPPFTIARLEEFLMRGYALQKRLDEILSKQPVAQKNETGKSTRGDPEKNPEDDPLHPRDQSLG